MKNNATIEQLKKEYQLTLSKFSHEIRNPIALISSELQIIASSHPEVTDYPCWEDMIDHVDYVKELLNEFSSYNNADQISPQPLCLADYLESILNIIRPTLEYLGIQLKTEIEPDLPELAIDSVKMRQALLNLLRNAQESISHPNGIIQVKAFSRNGIICICIRDNGCGISQEQSQTIFEPFVTFKPAGTGLGLSVTRQIIESHGGKIEFSSIPGQGSEFRIILG